LGDIWNKWIIWVRICKEGADREKNLGYGQSRTPLVLENIKANSPIRVDIAVINAGGEMNLWRLEWIISGEVDIQKEDSSSIRGVVRTHDSSLPMKHIISNWTSGAIRRWILSKVHKFFINSLQRHVNERLK